MLKLDLTMPTPSENLALDEALFLRHASGEVGECLRFWESEQPFVVMGTSGKTIEEVDRAACGQAGVPILRRPSGGGTVLQGPGCLNYALVLSLRDRPELSNFTHAWNVILERTAGALGDDVEHVGISDLAVGSLKFSGNAQKRKQQTILHHGTVLYDFDLRSMSRYLPEPIRRPDYRGERVHGAFVRNLELSRSEIVDRLSAAWGPTTAYEGEVPDLTELVTEKYTNDEWTFRF